LYPRALAFRDLCYVSMMGEVQRLANAADLVHEAAGCSGPMLVECFEDVVTNEGQDCPGLGHLSVSGQTKGEVELETRAFRHRFFVRAEASPVARTMNDQGLAVAVPLGRKGGIGSAGARRGFACLPPPLRPSWLEFGNSGRTNRPG